MGCLKLNNVTYLVLDEADSDIRTDAELLRSFVQQHDRTAVTIIVDRHGRMVMAVCRAILRNEDAAADAFQATFLVFLKKARSLNKPASLASWLYGVAYRVATRAKTRSMRWQIDEGTITDSPNKKFTDPATEVASAEAVNRHSEYS